MVITMSDNKVLPIVRFNEFKNNWKKLTLNEVLKINSGKDYKHLKVGNIPVYGTGGYMLSVNDKLSDKDAIGIGRKGTINKPQLLKAPFWTVDTLFFIHPLNKNDYYFIFSIMNKINWKKYDESTGVPSLSKATIEKINVFFPNSEEQIKIGKFFRKLDQTIVLQQQLLDDHKQLKKVMLQKMFPQKGESVPRVRFAGFYNDWEQLKLSEIAKYRRGSFPQPYGNKEWYDKENGSPFVQVADVGTNLQLVKKTKQNISKLAQPMSVSVEKGTILVTLQGSIGRVAITQYPAYVDRTILIFEDYKLLVNEYYFANVIEQLFNIEKRKAPGGTIKTITKEVLNEFKVFLPNIKEQDRIGKFLKQLDENIVLHKQKLETYQELKKAMLQKMFV